MDDNVEIKRQGRKYYESYCNWLWGSYRDVTDIFDLKFLFDEEEVREVKLSLIEDEEVRESMGVHGYYSAFLPYDEQSDEEWEENGDDPYPEIFDHNGEENEFIEEEEVWDQDVYFNEYNVRFDYRLGFIVDEYDSGIDELVPMRQKYPEDVEDTVFDPEVIKSALEYFQKKLSRSKS